LASVPVMRPTTGHPMTGRLEIDVIVDIPAWLEAVPTAEELCRRSAVAAIMASGAVRTEAEASVVLSNDARIRALNAAYRGKDEATNVLAFPATDVVERRAAGTVGPPLTIGDVVVAFETACAEAMLEGKSIEDHLSHLVVHGMLHLLGYDHQTEDEAAKMEGMEVAVLASLGVADPYSSVASCDAK
jgi:probable rRNA maturation factor